ncbi:serine hydrolase domain-containing protein [Kordia sp.]|uniref:serine hydrolase domain-containing protein n=1 Tax=Kordia sp. TaxID=1965332 RepID=UPI003D6A1F81
MKKRIMILIITVFAILVGLFIYRNTLSSEINKLQLDNYFTALEKNNGFMGSVAVFKKGELLYSKTVGFSDFEKKMKADKHTKYRIGSTTKTFTAVLTLKAVEEGKLSLDDKLNIYFPNIVNAKDIKIIHLLNHRSGIYSITSEPDFLNWRTKPKTREEILAIIKSGKSQFLPNSKAYYSNSNYILLTYILEDIYKKSYNDILKDKITKPLQLRNTYLDDKINTQDKESKSYRFIADWEAELESDISIPLGAGGMVSNPIDLAKFIKALFKGEILNPKTVKKITTFQETVGLGLFETVINGKVAYEHPGTIDGFRANYIYIPENDIIYTLMTNGLNFKEKDIQKTVLDAVYGKPIEIPEFEPTYEVTSKNLDTYLGVYTTSEIQHFKITINKKGTILTAQGTMQELFSTMAIDKHKFRIGAIGVKIEFKPNENIMIWEQNGKTIIFRRE